MKKLPSSFRAYLNNRFSFAFVSDVRLRRMRPHNQRARSSLLALEDQPSVFAGTVKILRQTSFQVHELNVCQQFIGSIADASPQLSASTANVNDTNYTSTNLLNQNWIQNEIKTKTIRSCWSIYLYFCYKHTHTHLFILIEIL